MSITHDPSRRGAYFDVEGPDGTGKSTAAKLLIRSLEHAGLDVLHVREPGGTETGEAIRRIVKDMGEERDGMVDLLLFSAARRQLLQRVVAPALRSGRVVISDRSLLSTYAYQGGAQGIPDSVIDVVSDLAVDSLVPDRTLILDLSDLEWDRRLGGRGGAGDRYEEITTRVAARDRYRELAGRWERAVRISAEGTPEAIAARMFDAVRPVLVERLLLPSRQAVRRM